MSSRSDNGSGDGPIRTVIIEDDTWLREHLADELKSHTGFECVGTYGTAEAALESLPDLKPGVAIVDINLPGMNGIDAARRIKSDPRITPPVIILVSASARDKDIIAAKNAGIGTPGFIRCGFVKSNQ